MINNQKLEDIRKNAEEASGLPFTAWTVSQAVEKDIPALLAEVECLQKIVSIVGGIGMGEKVTVTKEVAEALEYRRSVEGGGYTFEKFMQVKTARFHFGEPVAVLNDVPIETLASALINGYEVEQTPEEKVREFYEDLRKSSDGSIYSYRAEGVEYTLALLGITIEGVNA